MNLTKTAVALLSLATLAIASVTTSCDDKSSGGGFASGGSSLVLEPGPVSCSLEEAIYELSLIDTSSLTCTYSIAMDIPASCTVRSLSLHGSGDAPREDAIWVITPRTIAGGLVEEFPELSGGPRSGDVSGATWSTRIPAGWSALSESVTGTFQVIVTLEGDQTCEGVSPIYLRVVRD